MKNLIGPSTTKDGYIEDKGGLYLNLLDACPPFQIDGNFGATSGVTEMLLQSHLRDENGDYYQDILPALPAVFSSGKITGIKGSDGFEFSISWENHVLKQVEVKSLQGNKLNLRFNGKTISRETQLGQSHTFSITDFN